MNSMVAYVKISLSLLLLCCSPTAKHEVWTQIRLPAQAPSAEAQPFQAVHLLWVDVQQSHAEERMRTAMAGLNEAIRKAGCAACVYHLWRVSEGSPGGYNYMQQSNWPSRAMYDQVHGSPDYARASQGWTTLRSVVTREVYVRQSEIPLDN